MLQKMVFIFICFLFMYGEGASFYEDYCWRDYDDKIPSDAIVGGLNNKNKIIYICQAIFDYKLLPGKTLNGDKNCYLTFNNEEHAVNDSVQVLCSTRPDKFEWLPVFYNQIKDLRNKQVLEAGFEKGFHTYVGRVTTDTEITVSKVTCWAASCEKLSVLNNGSFQQYDKFDILVYNLAFEEKEVA